MNLPQDRPDPPGLPLARRRALLSAPLTLLLPAPPAWSQGQTRPRLDVPYLPTPQPLVERMLEIAQVGAGDVLYDLGCGDGRIVITAAKERGARGVGIDIDPERIREAERNASRAGVTDRVEFRVADLFESEFGEATVVTLYLLPDINRKLRPQLWRQLQVGTRIVSHAFDMGEEWPPERTELIDYRTLHAWTIRPEHKKRG